MKNTYITCKSISSKIEVLIINSKYYFNIFDLSKGLDYCTPKYLYNYYYKKNNYILIKNNKFIDINDIIIILNKIRKPNSKKLLQEILEITNVKYHTILPSRIEEDIYNSIRDNLEDYNELEVISNKKIGRFFPDILINKISNNKTNTILIIEINEHNHKIDLQRMNTLKLELNCENFININPNDKNFSIGKLLKDISNFTKKYLNIKII